MIRVFWGKVRKGKSRGKALGFPTANIALHQKIPEGIYISKIKLSSRWMPSLTFIGAAKTFGEKKIQAEAYILFSFPGETWEARLGNLRGKWISIKLLKKLRDNKKFASVKELITQMKEDAKLAKTFFQTNPKV